MARARFNRDDGAARREARLTELNGHLERAVGQLVSGEDWIQAMTFAARFRSRSFLNTLLIYVQHQAAYEEGRVPEPTPSYVAGFQQWRRLDRAPVKGQAGYLIRAPFTTRRASATPDDPASWRILSRGEQPEATESVRSSTSGSGKWAFVWDVSQTSGAPIPERPVPELLDGQAPEGLRDALIERVLAEDYGFIARPDPGRLGTALGMTSFSDRLVMVREGLPEAQQVKTLAHELGHVLLHEPVPEEASAHRGIQEVEAESVALMVCGSFGMDTSRYSVPYVATWASRMPDRTVAQAVAQTGARARDAALSLLERLPAPAWDDGLPPGAKIPQAPTRRLDPPAAEPPVAGRDAPTLGL